MFIKNLQLYFHTILLFIVNKYNKFLILVFIILMSVSIFWIYEEKILRSSFNVFYSDDGIPEIEED